MIITEGYCPELCLAIRIKSINQTCLQTEPVDSFLLCIADSLGLSVAKSFV